MMKKILILFAIMTFSCILAGCGKSEANGDKVFILPNGVKLEMVKITAGSFLMGSPDNEPDRYKLEVQHKVTLTESYMIGKYEITQQQYEVLMHNNPSLYKGARNPVEHVSWFDAKQFCDELNSRCAEQIPEGYHFDLPTEAQWEYACRAGSKTAFSCGNALSPQYAWYGGNPFREGDQHREVGLLKPNAWGLFDMHGNIDEWCLDWQGKYTGKNEINPTGPQEGDQRVTRGGNWYSRAEDCRSATHCALGNSPSYASSGIGFRVVLDSLNQ